MRSAETRREQRRSSSKRENEGRTRASTQLNNLRRRERKRREEREKEREREERGREREKRRKRENERREKEREEKKDREHEKREEREREERKREEREEKEREESKRRERERREDRVVERIRRKRERKEKERRVRRVRKKKRRKRERERIKWLFSSLLCSVDSHKVSLRVHPDQCVFEKWNSMYLSCEDSTGLWTGNVSVLRNTNKETITRCGKDWGQVNESMCWVRGLSPKLDTGLYWCESSHGHYVTLNITVTERLEQNISTACPPSASTPSPPPANTTTSRSPLPSWMWPALGSGLGLVLGLVLVLLVLLVKRSRQRTAEQNGRQRKSPTASSVCHMIASDQSDEPKVLLRGVVSLRGRGQSEGVWSIWGDKYHMKELQFKACGLVELGPESLWSEGANIKHASSFPLKATATNLHRCGQFDRSIRLTTSVPAW
ncbi:hypothetical protein WMY93_028237 [Mugilogobius chulae]|uniref:Ig-like domain-containing protein n=1 Tax=Mugilogobius chulae TaxID=88201 RepID=A0AAW0MZV7_9GOBI